MKRLLAVAAVIISVVMSLIFFSPQYAIASLDAGDSHGPAIAPAATSGIAIPAATTEQAPKPDRKTALLSARREVARTDSIPTLAEPREQRYE